MIGGASVDDVDNLSSAIENHELFFNFGPQLMFDIVEILGALSVSEKTNPDEPKYPFELYKKDFLADHVELTKTEDVKFEELQLVTISCFATVFRFKARNRKTNVLQKYLNVNQNVTSRNSLFESVVCYFGMMEGFFDKRRVHGSPPKMPTFSVFIHRLSFSCRSIVSGQTRSNEQKSQGTDPIQKNYSFMKSSLTNFEFGSFIKVALNSLSLAALTAAVADLPLKGNRPP